MYCCFPLYDLLLSMLHCLFHFLQSRSINNYLRTFVSKYKWTHHITSSCSMKDFILTRIRGGSFKFITLVVAPLVLVFGTTVWYSGISPSTFNKVVVQSKNRIHSPKTKQNVDILVIVMGEAKSHPMWKKRIANITGSVSLLYGSFDEEIPSNYCENEFGLFCEETIFIPGTTWTQGRNLLAAQAVRKERKREKKYDYWIFIDDDVSPVCEGGEPMEQFFGKGNCWQKLFNFISSDQIPEKVSTLSLALNSGPSGFVGVSNTDAMFASFKREQVPYLLPYATIQEGWSEWTSQAALFCVVQTRMKSSVMYIPYIGALNEAHRLHTRGLNITEVRETIANNYHDDTAGFKPCQELRIDQLSQEGWDKSSTFNTASHLNSIIPEPELEVCEPMKKRFEQWESQIENEISKSQSGHVQPLVQNVDILVIVMGEAKLYNIWKEKIGNIAGLVSLLYGSFDEEIPSNYCENEFGLFCEETIFIPGTTWTQGRNLLAAQAVRKERKREKKYDYWIFIDDDIKLDCEKGGEPMEQFFGKGNCWQKLFNFISSDQIPEKVSTLSLAGGLGPPGFVGVSNTDAMFAAFKREQVPYLLPYVTIKEGGSQWTSQAALFCVVQTCMKSSVMYIPYIGALNEAHREYTRGVNITEVRETIANNYHDDTAGFKPCQELRNDQINQDNWWESSTFNTASHLNNIIPKPEFEVCEPMKKRFEQWESQIESEIF